MSAGALGVGVPVFVGFIPDDLGPGDPARVRCRNGVIVGGPWHRDEPIPCGQDAGRLFAQRCWLVNVEGAGAWYLPELYLIPRGGDDADTVRDAAIDRELARRGLLPEYTS